MFDKLKLKLSANRMQGRRTSRRTSRRARPSFWRRVWNIICWPFRMIGRALRYIWALICRINLIGLINATLLVAIIVLFSMLIIDIRGCRKDKAVVISDAPSVSVVSSRPQVTVTNEKMPKTLPLRRSASTRKYIGGTITVAESHKDTVARAQSRFNGDVIIEHRSVDPVLTDNVYINGNLYLQNMRKYTLPCGAHINGNLFVRDVAMLQFCGDFTVNGNIYVSPRSSFGPIPRTARLNGQIIL